MELIFPNTRVFQRIFFLFLPFLPPLSRRFEINLGIRVSEPERRTLASSKFSESFKPLLPFLHLSFALSFLGEGQQLSYEMYLFLCKFRSLLKKLFERNVTDSLFFFFFISSFSKKTIEWIDSVTFQFTSENQVYRRYLLEVQNKKKEEKTPKES